MTRTNYIFARLLSTFEIAPLEKYRTAAATENHLLRDSEAMVGQLVWDNLEGVEDISAEYWKLRKIRKSRDELQSEVERLNELLDSAQEARALALEEVAESTKDQVTEREKVAERIERLHQEREDVQKDGRSIKRAHAGLKTKLEVLLEETEGEMTPEVSATRENLSFKRIQFEKIKERRDEIDARIEDLQKKLTQLSETFEEENTSIRMKAEKQFSTIGKTNKDLSALNNKVGLLENQCEELYAEIGRFVLGNSKDPEISGAIKKHRNLLTLIDEVRASSNRHRKLLGI